MSFSWSSRCPQSPGGPHLTPWASASSRVRNREGQGRAGGAPGAPARPRAPSAPGSPGRWRGRAQPVPAAGGWGTPARGLGDSKMSLGAAGVLAWRGPHRALARLRSGESRAVPAQQPPAPAPPAVSPAGAAEGRIPRGTSREARARQRRRGCSDGTNRGAVRPAGPAHGAWPEGRGLHPAPRARAPRELAGRRALCPAPASRARPSSGRGCGRARHTLEQVSSLTCVVLSSLLKTCLVFASTL